MAEVIELTDLVNLSNQTTAVNAINSNNETIEVAFLDVLSLSGQAPNQMLSNLDMNSNQIINLPSPITGSSPLRLQDAATLNGGGTIQSIPVGGTTGQVLEKNSNTNYDVSWQTLPTVNGLLPTGGTASQILTKNSSTNFDASWQTVSVTPANPTASIGLTAVNGVATTIMRSDAAPPLNQNIAPSWTNLHTWTSWGIAMSSTAQIQAAVFGYFDPNPLTQETLGTTGVRTTGAEANLCLHMGSSVGAASGAAAFKANLLTDCVANAGSAPVWSQASVVTMNSGFSLSGTVYESDLNVFNQNYVNSIATGPWAVNFFASGTHNANHFYGTAAYSATSTGDAFPLWNYGLYLGEAGYQTFNTATIFDKSNAPSSYIANGSHNGIVFNIQNTHATAGDIGMLLGIGLQTATDTTSLFLDLVNPANSIQAGSVTRADSGGVAHAAFNTSSDERLKKDLGLVTDSLERINNIKVHKYIGRDHDSDGRDYNIGFFAQELYQQFPWAVTPHTEEDYLRYPWQVDYGRVTPLLTAGIQDLYKEIQILKARLSELEKK